MNETQKLNQAKFHDICKMLDVEPDPKYRDNHWRGCFEYEGQKFLVSWQKSAKFEFHACRPELRDSGNQWGLERFWDAIETRTINQATTKTVTVLVKSFRKRFDFDAFKQYRNQLQESTDNHDDRLANHHERLQRMTKLTGFQPFGRYNHATDKIEVSPKSESNELRTTYFGKIQLTYESAEFNFRAKDPATIDKICKFIADNCESFE